MTPLDHALKAVREMALGNSSTLIASIEEEMKAAMRDARDFALEEAAKVSEKECGICCEEEVSTSIRALLSSAKGGE